MIRSTLALLLLSMPLAAQDFDGQYQISQCTPGPSDSQMSIRGDRIEFWESSCEMSNPVDLRDMGQATLYDLKCTGEGEEWSDRVLLMEGVEADLIMLREGFVSFYQRCN
ncbi:MAG: hypothetical protein RIB61_05785 [Roseicyclus sp.]|jgi:hypothetical protein